MTGHHNPEEDTNPPSVTLIDILGTAIKARGDLIDPQHETALRLFNGFLEGCPDLVVDLYARTAVLYNYASPPDTVQIMLGAIQQILLNHLPWLRAIVVKTRHGSDEQDRLGRLVYGENFDKRITEQGVRYAIDVLINQDASLYLDTRNLRLWAKTHLTGKTVLNTFAYTGSYGVAAAVGGAERVVHLDLNRRYLNLAKTSYTLNGIPVERPDFIQGDFWKSINHLKRTNELFDCIFLDPPFFSTSHGGTVDLLRNNKTTINKVRPLVKDGGYLVAINNALYVSGEDYLRTLEELCADGYLMIESFIPVPPDFTGYAHTRVGSLPADPAPFNHSTKIALLSVRRKDGR